MKKTLTQIIAEKKAKKENKKHTGLFLENEKRFSVGKILSGGK